MLDRDDLELYGVEVGDRVLRPAPRPGEVRGPGGPDRADAHRRRADPAPAARRLTGAAELPLRRGAAHAVQSAIVISGAYRAIASRARWWSASLSPAQASATTETDAARVRRGQRRRQHAAVGGDPGQHQRRVRPTAAARSGPHLPKVGRADHRAVEPGDGRDQVVQRVGRPGPARTASPRSSRSRRRSAAAGATNRVRTTRSAKAGSSGRGRRGGPVELAASARRCAGSAKITCRSMATSQGRRSRRDRLLGRGSAARDSSSVPAKPTSSDDQHAEVRVRPGALPAAERAEQVALPAQPRGEACW